MKNLECRILNLEAGRSSRLRYSKFKILNSQPGFTLIELLLYVGLSSIILLVISMFLAMLLQARIKNQAIAEVDQQGQRAMRAIMQAARNATSVTSPGQGASASALVLATSASSTNPTRFDLNASSSLRIAEAASSPVPLTNGRVTISGLTFQNLSRPDTPGAVRIQFTMSYVNVSGKNEYRVDKTFAGTAALK
jgi:Tfp pilus assembly protein PilW